MEDTLWWKTIFDGRQPLMEDNLWLKTTFDGIWHLIDEEIWWKTTFDKEDALLWTTTFNWRCPLMEGNLKPWDFLTATFSVTVCAVVRCSYTGCDSTIELLHYDLKWLKMAQTPNKAFIGLGSCNNVQTEWPIFEYANWQFFLVICHVWRKFTIK